MSVENGMDITVVITLPPYNPTHTLRVFVFLTRLISQISNSKEDIRRAPKLLEEQRPKSG